MKHFRRVSVARVAYAQEEWPNMTKSILGPATIASGIAWLVCQLVKDV